MKAEELLLLLLGMFVQLRTTALTDVVVHVRLEAVHNSAVDSLLAPIVLASDLFHPRAASDLHQAAYKVTQRHKRI